MILNSFCYLQDGKVWTRANDLLQDLFLRMGNNVEGIFAAAGTTVDAYGNLRVVFAEALGFGTTKYQNELYHCLLYTSTHPSQQVNHVPGQLVDAIQLQTKALYKRTRHPFNHAGDAKPEMEIDIRVDNGVSIASMRDHDVEYLRLLASCDDRVMVPESFFYLYGQNVVPKPVIVDTPMIQETEPSITVNAEMVRKAQIIALVGEMAKKAREEERNNREYYNC